MEVALTQFLLRYRKPITRVILGFFIFIVVTFLLIFTNNQTAPSGELATGNHHLSDAVLRYKSTIEKYAKQYGGTEYVPYILALMQVESGGEGGDPMQASESLGLAPNTIQNPEKSIQQGVKYFVANVKSANSKGADLKTALQSYNYGSGFVAFVAQNGGTYSFDLAKQFSSTKSGGKKVSYINALSTAMGYTYRYNYGNMFYVAKLMEYVNESTSSVQNTNAGISLQSVPSEFKKQLRYPVYDGRDYNTSGSYPFGQCTWYVYNRMAQLGKPVDEFMGNGSAWGIKGKILGYSVTNTPKVGTAVCFAPGVFDADPVYGHVAFVEVVNVDGSLLISECNVIDPGSGTVSYRVVPSSIAKALLYIG